MKHLLKLGVLYILALVPITSVSFAAQSALQLQGPNPRPEKPWGLGPGSKTSIHAIRHAEE